MNKAVTHLFHIPKGLNAPSHSEDTPATRENEGSMSLLSLTAMRAPGDQTLTLARGEATGVLQCDLPRGLGGPFSDRAKSDTPLP